jgi:hypothetical protein
MPAIIKVIPIVIVDVKVVGAYQSSAQYSGHGSTSMNEKPPYWKRGYPMNIVGRLRMRNECALPK